MSLFIEGLGRYEVVIGDCEDCCLGIACQLEKHELFKGDNCYNKIGDGTIFKEVECKKTLEEKGKHMDLELEKLKEGNRLEELCNKQKSFDDYMCKNQGLDTEDEATKKMLLANCLTALQVEVSELQNELALFKHWKVNKPDSITEHSKEEFVDCLCFLISIGNKMFADSDEMMDYYDKKMEINVERQDNNY